MRTVLAIAIPILLCFAVGFVSSQVQAEAIRTWYPTLNKPALTPPNSVFPIAWSIIYVLSGISAGLIYLSNHPRRGLLLGLFLAHLALQFLWCLTFFRMQSPFTGLFVIVALECAIVAYVVLARHVNRWSSTLYIPVLAWVAFATYLNAYILLHN